MFSAGIEKTSVMKWVKSHLIFSYLFWYLYILETVDSLYNYKASYKIKLLNSLM